MDEKQKTAGKELVVKVVILLAQSCAFVSVNSSQNL